MEPLGDEQALRQGSSILIGEAWGACLLFPPREESVASLTERKPRPDHAGTLILDPGLSKLWESNPWFFCVCLFYKEFNFLNICFIDLRERDGEGMEKDTSINCLPHAHQLGIEPTIYALTRNQTSELSARANSCCLGVIQFAVFCYNILNRLQQESHFKKVGFAKDFRWMWWKDILGHFIDSNSSVHSLYKTNRK